MEIVDQTSMARVSSANVQRVWLMRALGYRQGQYLLKYLKRYSNI